VIVDFEVPEDHQARRVFMVKKVIVVNMVTKENE
jgi:hypothetical protein